VARRPRYIEDVLPDDASDSRRFAAFERDRDPRWVGVLGLLVIALIVVAAVLIGR
jgi:hypothetical protein